jgi:hypothetical protein
MEWNQDCYGFQPAAYSLNSFDALNEMYYMIYLLTAVVLTPGGSSTVHIYTNNTQNNTIDTNNTWNKTVH